jgi:hypothetical protein
MVVMHDLTIGVVDCDEESHLADAPTSRAPRHHANTTGSQAAHDAERGHAVRRSCTNASQLSWVPSA